jgi:UDP-glucose 4-epimerase
LGWRDCADTVIVSKHMSFKRILVTGGAGFIGSCLVRRLLGAGHRVVIVDNFSTGLRRNLPAGVELVEGDIGSEATIAAVPAGPFDAVCHLAAQTSGAVSMEQPGYDLRTNALSTVLLTRWCQQQGVGRFIYASSMAVYGDPPRLPATEETPLIPRSFYGISKLTSEHVLRVATSTSFRPTALRMFNVYGPGQNLANLRQGMASIYLAYLLQGQEVPVTGSMERFRDFVYIDDVVEAWMNVLERPETPSPVYNIGSGQATTVRDLLRLLVAACDLPADYPIRQITASPGDQFGLFADARRAALELGWIPRTPISEGLRRMVAWAKSERNG